MRLVVALTAVVAVAASQPVVAQERDDEAAAAELEHTLRDPGMQAAVADGVAAASEALLDVPLAPLARAVAEASGEDPDAVDPDMTLREVSPEASDVPARAREQVPRLMGAMGAMAGGFDAMMPALREMAERMERAVAHAAESR